MFVIYTKFLNLRSAQCGIKSPKLYFYDTGLVCSLLGIKTAQELFIHPLRGPLFESMIISELFKYQFNTGATPSLYFWRDIQGHEIDCIIEKSIDNLVPIEIKSGMTISSEFFKGIANWDTISRQKSTSAFVIYGGNTVHQHAQATIIPWNKTSTIAP